MKYFSIKTLFKITLIRVSLCFEGVQGIYNFLFFYFFCGILKLICESRHKFFINLRLRRINNLRPSALFLRNLRSAVGKFTYSAACGNAYAPPPPLYMPGFVKNTLNHRCLTGFWIFRKFRIYQDSKYARVTHGS